MARLNSLPRRRIARHRLTDLANLLSRSTPGWKIEADKPDHRNEIFAVLHGPEKRSRRRSDDANFQSQFRTVKFEDIADKSGSFGQIA